jgi:hypothetical protein
MTVRLVTPGVRVSRKLAFDVCVEETARREAVSARDPHRPRCMLHTMDQWTHTVSQTLLALLLTQLGLGNIEVIMFFSLGRILCALCVFGLCMNE